MRKLTLFLLLFCSAIAYSQASEVKRFTFEKEKQHKTPILYLGPGSGLYTYTGLVGFMAEVPIIPHFTVFAGGGLGGWGYKLGGGALFYLHKDDYLGSAFGVGVSNAFGIDNFETSSFSLEGNNGETSYVVLDLYNAPSLNLSYQYHIKMGTAGKFVIGTGYAFPMVDSPYKLVD